MMPKTNATAYEVSADSTETTHAVDERAVKGRDADAEREDADDEDLDHWTDEIGSPQELADGGRALRDGHRVVHHVAVDQRGSDRFRRRAAAPCAGRASGRDAGHRAP